MSEYLKKIEKDYNDGKISLKEITALRNEYNKLSSNNKKYEFAKYGLERDAFWKSKYPTSRTLFRVLEVLNIISVVILMIFLMVAIVEELGIAVIISAALIIGISLVMFLLAKEIILFQVDRNFFEYKQTEKLLK